MEPGSVCDAFLSSMEILPMLCSAAGIRPPKGVKLDGHDMAPVLVGMQKSPRLEKKCSGSAAAIKQPVSELLICRGPLIECKIISFLDLAGTSL